MRQSARRLITAAALGAIAFAGALSAPTLATAQVYNAPTHTKYAAVVVDAASGEVLYDRRGDSPRYPASITKVMTLYMAFEAMAAGRLEGSDEIVMSPRAAAQPPSKLGIRAGDTLTVDEAISALAVNSANDVAVALAEKIGGTEQRFAALMTLRAQELGMANTRFTNASGLPDSRQLTSARDIATLSRAVMRDFPQYYGRFGQRHFAFRGRGAHRNHNGLLHTMPGVDGLKTGYTNASGYNLAASAVRDGRRLIAVMLGGNSTASRNAHVQDLLNAGFSVATRRARGDTITMAAMFPDRSPAMPVAPTQYASARGSIEQGDTEPAPGRPARAARGEATATEMAAAELKLNRRLAAAAEAKAARKAKPAKPAKVEAEETAAPERGAWLVQVGAFKSEADARDRLKQVVNLFGRPFRGRETAVEKTESGGGHFRARFAGFTQADAKAACRALEAKRQPCMTVKA